MRNVGMTPATSIRKRFVWESVTRQSLKILLTSMKSQNSLALTPLLLVILLFGLACRIVLLHEPIRHDEGYTILNLAPQPIRVIASDYSAPGNHVLYSILTHYSFKLFGPKYME